MNFDSLGAFADHLATLTLEPQMNEALEKIGQAVQAQAQLEMGVYQRGIGPFPDWVELADSTKEQRVALGYTENDPLRRSGELANSITHVVDTVPAAWHGREAKGEVVIGSEDPVMAYQELGTSRIPPRPVLGPAVLRQEPFIKAIAGYALATGLLPRGYAVRALDYKTTI